MSKRSHTDADDVILKSTFDINTIECVHFKLVARSEFQQFKEWLHTHTAFVAEPYHSCPPSESYGDTMTALELLDTLEVIEDPDKVQAFRMFHGDEFFVADDLLNRVFEEMDDDHSRTFDILVDLELIETTVAKENDIQGDVLDDRRQMLFFLQNEVCDFIRNETPMATVEESKVHIRAFTAHLSGSPGSRSKVIAFINEFNAIPRICHIGGYPIDTGAWRHISVRLVMRQKVKRYG